MCSQWAICAIFVMVLTTLFCNLTKISKLGPQKREPQLICGINNDLSFTTKTWCRYIYIYIYNVEHN